MRYAITGLIAAVLLSSCAAADIERKTKALNVPDVQEYTKAQQNEAADELESCPDCDMIERFLIGYKVMRDQARALKKRF